MRTANELRSEMASKGLTVQEVARRTGASYQRVWNQLHGRTALTEQDAERIVRVLEGEPGNASPPARAQRGAGAPSQRGLDRRRAERRQASAGQFVVIVSRWNEFVTNELLSGALDELRTHGDPPVRVLR